MTAWREAHGTPRGADFQSISVPANASMRSIDGDWKERNHGGRQTGLRPVTSLTRSQNSDTHHGNTDAAGPDSSGEDAFNGGDDMKPRWTAGAVVVVGATASDSPTGSTAVSRGPIGDRADAPDHQPRQEDIRVCRSLGRQGSRRG